MRPQGHKVAPPRRHRSCRAAHQIAVAELQRRHRFAERQLKLVARIRAPEHAGRCDCSSACCSSAVSQACVSLVVRGVGRRNSERHRRAADKRCCCRSSCSLPSAIRRALPTASACGTHNRSQRFIAVLLVLVRQMRTRKVGLAASTTHCHSASCRTLGTLAHYSHALLHMSCRAVPASLFPSRRDD